MQMPSPGAPLQGASTYADLMDAADPGAASSSRHMPWTSSVEALLAGWCDQAKSYEWMHAEAASRFDARARRLMVALCVLNAMSGLGNMVTGDVSWGALRAAYLFGGISVASAFTTILQDKLGWAAAADYHRRMAITQGSIRRKLEEELSLPPGSRRDCGAFLRLVRADINAAAVQSTGRIPKSIRDRCYTRFRGVPDFDLPEVCGHVEHTRVFVNPAAGTGAGAAALTLRSPGSPPLRLDASSASATATAASSTASSSASSASSASAASAAAAAVSLSTPTAPR